MKENKQVRAVCSAFIKKDKKILFTYDPFFKKWRVPGGKLEKYESAEDCVTREVKEETNFDVKNHKFLGFGQDAHTAFFKKLGYEKKCPRLIMYFSVDVFGDSEFSPDLGEIAKHKWLTLEEIKKHPNKEGSLEDLFKRNPKLKV
jgi:ADP-ribose pyrophosphatase YjhB (NUDIX family)